MKRKYVLAAAVLAAFGITHSLAQDKQMTVGEYTQHLKDVYGDSGVVIAATVNGRTQGGQIKTDIYPSPDESTLFFNAPISVASLTITEAQCDPAQVITRITSGAFTYVWCARTQTISGTTYEAKRDTLYYSGGRFTYITSNRFDCQNSGDLAAMPNAVKLAVCP